MGSSSSTQLYDLSGNKLTNRKCIVFISPPSFQTTKFLSAFPVQFPYQYITVGQLIRDQLNRKTKYSQMIMENLQKHKKINDKILQILLKNTALQGNFMIQFFPKDDEDLHIWQGFLHQVQVIAVIIVEPDPNKLDFQTTNQVKQLYSVKIKQFLKNVKKIKDIVTENKIHKFSEADKQLGNKVIQLINSKDKFLK